MLPVVFPPIIISPQVITPPGTNPPSQTIIPGVNLPPPSSSTSRTCPINALKLGLCLDVLGGLVYVGLGNPVENACCPVLGGLLEIEATYKYKYVRCKCVQNTRICTLHICICTPSKLSISIFIPLAIQALITCGKTPPPGFVCPPL
uniref:Hydrophobic seed protein domain-containing protein n=1 Tax=Nelumbo nucifera TaxID=4432 RepID=A0A822XDZ3_NELNU|nr:TPA_asm: hypothetical protein HUJ06_020013 [Nelumbo nucifera]